MWQLGLGVEWQRLVWYGLAAEVRRGEVWCGWNGKVRQLRNGMDC